MKPIEQAYREFEKGLSKAMLRHRTGAGAPEINEAITYARDQLNFIIEEMRIQGLTNPGSGVAPIASLEARLEAMEMLAEIRAR